MTQEEKAKAYDEALEIARKINSGEGVPAPSDWTKLEVVFPQLRESEDERIRKEINTLYSEIDTCISELLKARTDKDSEAEGKALFKMEGLMVATLQDLSCIEDYLEKQKEQKPAEWSEEDKLTIADLINYFEGDSLECSAEEMVQRIKSLHPSWKPSDQDELMKLKYAGTSTKLD